MTQWFGKSWGAPCCEEDEHVPTPVWEKCTRCKEPIRDGDQGMVTPLVMLDGTHEVIAYHLDCFLKGILPHGPECPHCRGVEPRNHAPECQRNETGLCTCIPMPDGKAHGLVAVMVDDAETLGNPELHEFDGEPQ